MAEAEFLTLYILVAKIFVYTFDDVFSTVTLHCYSLKQTSWVPWQRQSSLELYYC